MRNVNLRKTIVSALFLSIALLLPFLTGQIPQIGKMLLPMHIPVLLCGFICGWQYGLAVGFIAPLLRSVIFSNPTMFPTAVIMAFELAAYGFFAGFIFSLIRRKNIGTIYISLVCSMILGRLIKGVVQFLVLGFTDEGFVLTAFVAGAFTNAIPGIILQLILIPPLVIVLEKTKLISFEKSGGLL